jgi:hypothetical protein
LLQRLQFQGSDPDAAAADICCQESTFPTRLIPIDVWVEAARSLFEVGTGPVVFLDGGTMSNRPMSAKQYRAALADLQLSQARAGWIFGGKSKDSGRLWPSEGAPYYVALIISLMRMYDITPDDIEEIGAQFRKKTK